MKKLMIVISLTAAVLASGCGNSKPVTLGAMETDRSIQAQYEKETRLTKGHYAKELARLIHFHDREIGQAKWVWKRGLISAEACSARLVAIDQKWAVRQSELDNRTILQLAEIKDHCDQKMALWGARK